MVGDTVEIPPQYFHFLPHIRNGKLFLVFASFYKCIPDLDLHLCSMSFPFVVIEVSAFDMEWLVKSKSPFNPCFENLIPRTHIIKRIPRRAATIRHNN